MIISYPNHFIVAEWTLNLIPPLDFPDKAKYYGHTANHLAVSFSHFFYNDCVNLKGFFYNTSQDHILQDHICSAIDKFLSLFDIASLQSPSRHQTVVLLIT